MHQKFVEAAKIRGYRNISSQELSFNKESTVFIGSNGQGKTSALEALFLVLTGDLAKKARAADVVQTGKKICSVRTFLAEKDGQRRREVRLLRNEGNRFQREILEEGGKKTRRQQRLFIPCVFFCPADLRLFEGGPSRRREFLDAALNQGGANYGRKLSGYKRTLRERNVLLEKARKGEKRDPALLEILTDRLAQLGSDIWAETYLFWDEYKNHLQETLGHVWYDVKVPTLTYLSKPARRGKKVDKEEIKVFYREELERRRKTEERLGRTTLGPHLDDIDIRMEGQPFRGRASRGETRTVIIALKKALGDYYEQYNQTRAVYILDDIFSELDQNQAEQIQKAIMGRQSFLSSVLSLEQARQQPVTKGSAFYIAQQGEFQYV